MLEDLITEAGRAGLEIHPTKTKILTNDSDEKRGSVTVAGQRVDALASTGAADYLGRRLTCSNVHDTEIDARLDKAWKRFFSLKQELCGKHICLRERIKLSEATVTPTLLYGSTAWTMTVAREHKIRRAQRKMLQWMLGSFWKRPAEDTSDSCESEAELEEEEEEEEDEEGGGGSR